MRNRQLLINMVANIISFIINAGTAFFLTPYLINKVGSGAYGFVPLASNFVNYVTILTTALNSMASRFISIEINSNNNEKANSYFNSVLVANTIISIVLIIPSVLAILNLSNLLNIPSTILLDVQLTFGFAFLNMVIALIGNVFAVATFSRNRLDLREARSIEGSIIRVSVLIGLFIVFSPKIYFITVTTTLATLYKIITNIYYTNKLLPNIKMNLLKFNFKAVKELISSGVWNSINQLSVILLTSLDLLIANIFLGPLAGGHLAIVKILPIFIQSFVSKLVNVFVPEFTILYAQKKWKELLISINNSIKVMSLINTIPISFLIIFGDTFFSLWVPNENSNSLYLLSNLTLIPMIITGSINTIFNVYTVTNKLKVPSLVLLITGVLNLIIVVVLLKTTSLGIIAIPLTALIVGTLRNLIFTPLYAAKCLDVKWNSFYKAILRGSVCSLVMMAICWIFKVNIQVDNWFELFGIAVASTLLALIINAFIIFNKNERTAILKKVKNTFKNRFKRKL
ncbi:MATE family efflux transporter [Lederbergia panacisoli]|uniref:MATE family efflux transporter n=1 Tax=Lederbergia panacisoli TaxID=1255251 RepID=UPI00214B940D|nr:MATE family efflux transporter [Lederbergia panacisoli]MCR2823823.1 MATE family efflux transporter [Lederbergia panacisoli]